MALFDYNVYRILLNEDSKKSQGLHTGDIVRRQYFDGKNLIYSLMCVTDYGEEIIGTPSPGTKRSRQYFQGALLEGDAPRTDELLDFARITNLFDIDRSGALYLTASDDKAPFMDVIDGIGRNASLSWPESIATEDFQDAKSQYVVEGADNFLMSYTPILTEYSRVLTIERRYAKTESFEGLRQEFYQYVKNPNRVLISYRVRASRPMTLSASFGYINDARMDGEWEEAITEDWQYKFRAVTVEYSGRHLRQFKLNFEDLSIGDSVQIADFNIILLSSVSNFADASTMRVGKLDGVVDPVYGTLEGYGAYIQKLYVANAAHVSGTLTAGDENGFGATFYAGKIHRNVFMNSLDVSFNDNIHIDHTVVNPTGVGNVYRTESNCAMTVQTNAWLQQHQGERFTFSFWAYAKRQCAIGIQQNGRTVGSIVILPSQTFEWRRVHVYFDLISPVGNDPMTIGIIPSWGDPVYNSIGSIETNPETTQLYISAPQLEKGTTVTQYQPTDDVLNETDEYGAWFSRGGIGGTIQNPLLRLNHDGNGSIGTRENGFELRVDGSGFLAKRNIKWDALGRVTFGRDVTLDWENLSDNTQDQIANRYIKIQGEDTFTIIGQETAGDGKTYDPASIVLTLEETGFTSSSSQRQWYYLYHGTFVPIEDANAKTLTIDPESEWFDNTSSLTVKCEVRLNDTHTYTDVKTVKKQYVQGYTVKISSSQGNAFKNGVCRTILTADVYYQGKLVDVDFAEANFDFIWHRYKQGDLENELPLNDTDTTDGPRIITLDYRLDGSDVFVCELATSDSFEYSFPILF